MIQPFEAYSLFVALRNHFTKKSYDFFKYNRKTKVSYNSFSARSDQFHYQKLARKCPNEKDLINFVVANMIEGRTWITDMVAGDFSVADESYRKFSLYMDALAYEFQKELDYLMSKVTDPAMLFSTKAGYPIILNEYLAGSIRLPTLVVLNDFVSFEKKFTKAFGEDDVVWGKTLFLMQKLQPFVKYNRAKVKEVLERKMLNNG